MDRLGEFEFGEPGDGEALEDEAAMLGESDADPVTEPATPNDAAVPPDEGGRTADDGASAAADASAAFHGLLGAAAPAAWPSLPWDAAGYEPRARLVDWDLLVGLAGAAARASSESTATGLAAAMVPVALRLVPSLEQSLWPAIPALVRGSMILTWEARRGHDATARLAALPLVLRGSVAVLAEAVRNAQPLPDEEQVLRWLRAEMRRVLASVQRTRPARARPQPPRPAEAPLERRASPLAHRNGTRHVEAAQWP